MENIQYPFSILLMVLNNKKLLFNDNCYGRHVIDILSNYFYSLYFNIEMNNSLQLNKCNKIHEIGNLTL